MTRQWQAAYSDDMIVDLDDFVPHDPAEPVEPAAQAGRDSQTVPDLLLCLAAQDTQEQPERLRTLAELVYRVEEALLARGAAVTRALCCGAAALPFAAITAPDALPRDAFAPVVRQAQPLLQSLAQACAMAASFPSDRPTRLVLLTDLPPDGLPQAMLRRMLGQLAEHRPCLRAALAYCGQEQTVWTARLRDVQLLRVILPEESEQMYDFLFEGGIP